MWLGVESTKKSFMNYKQEYNNKYSGPILYWGNKPHCLAVHLKKILPVNSSVLDLGCGEGQNAVYLAKHGFCVTAADLSEKGIDRLKNLAKTRKVNINTCVCDAVNFIKNSSEYNAIICANLFQFIPSDRISEFINNIREKTSINGYNVIASFVAENEVQKQKAISQGRYLFDKDELKSFYSNWQIIEYSEKLSSWETHGEPKHRHFVVKMIAKKVL